MLVANSARAGSSLELLTAILPAATVLAVSTVGQVAAIMLLRRLGVVDNPNHRSSHDRPTLRGGGCALAIGAVAGLGIAHLIAPSQAMSWLLAAVVMGAAAALGLVEDIRGLPVTARMLGQGLLAIAGAVGLWLLGPDGGLAFWLVPLGMLAGVFYINAANFVDGINGISSAMGTVAGLYFALLGGITGSEPLHMIGLIVAAMFAAFWPWNAPVARIFLGDVGSYLLGGAVWFTSLLAMSAGVSPIAAAAPMLISAADVLITLSRRKRRGERLTEAHRDHIYQRLARRWNSHLRATAFATLACVTACGGGFLIVWSGSWQSVVVSRSLTILGMLIMVASVLLYVRGEGLTRTRQEVYGGRGRD